MARGVGLDNIIPYVKACRWESVTEGGVCLSFNPYIAATAFTTVIIPVLTLTVLNLQLVQISSLYTLTRHLSRRCTKPSGHIACHRVVCAHAQIDGWVDGRDEIPVAEHG